jgi:hypothetical protein
MRNSKYSMAIQMIFVTLMLGFVLGAYEPASTCTGSDPCNACKNCKYCKHCAKEGGSCGVCKSIRFTSFI